MPDHDHGAFPPPARADQGLLADFQVVTGAGQRTLVDGYLDRSLRCQHLADAVQQAIVVRQQADQQAAIWKVDRDPMRPAVEHSRRTGRVAPEQGQVGRPPARIAPHLIETRVDTDHAQVGPLPGEAQREGCVAGAKIEMNPVVSRTPIIEFRRR